MSEAYIAWNQRTRHQLIVAHMTICEAVSQAEEKLAKALGARTSYGLQELVDMAVAAIEEHKR